MVNIYVVNSLANLTYQTSLKNILVYLNFYVYERGLFCLMV